jgi:hypothetical protein
VSKGKPDGLIAAVIRIADAFDRLVTLLEEVAEAIELPRLPPAEPEEDESTKEEA